MAVYWPATRSLNILCPGRAKGKVSDTGVHTLVTSALWREAPDMFDLRTDKPF